MKMMVILAVLFVNLLVVTGAAFAGICCEDLCYKVTGTDLTNPNNSFTQDWSFCGDGDNLVDVCNLNGSILLFEASLFNQSLIIQAISIDPVSTGAYMRFHGGSIFNGLLYFGGDQYNIHGISEPCPH